LWDAPDVSLLANALGNLQLLFDRADECRQILGALNRGLPSDVHPEFSESQCQTIAHIARDFLNMDQVLVSRVSRTEKGLRVTGIYADGYGDRESKKIKEHTQREVDFAAASRRPPFRIRDWDAASTESRSPEDCEKPDIMALIAQLYFQSSADSEIPSAFIVNHEHTYRNFTLDNPLAKESNIVGDVLFLPCVTVGRDGTKSLRAILMLSSSSGSPPIDGREGVSQSLASQIALAMASDDDVFVEERLRRIREESRLNRGTLQCICEKAAIVTRALVSRIWLRADLAASIAERAFNSSGLMRVIQQYMQQAARSGHCLESPPGVRLLLSFFGIAVEDFREVAINASGVLAQQVAENLYIPVSHWDVLDQTDRAAAGVMDDVLTMWSRLEKISHPGTDAHAFCTEVEKVLERSYLPGHGITGWVLRYGNRTLRLDSLTADSVAKIEKKYPELFGPYQPKTVDRIVEREVPVAVHVGCCNLPVPTPCSLQHVRDHSHKVREPLDTFMCAPFGCLDPMEYPRGIIRVALSSSSSGRFSPEDESRLGMIASHLTDLLMAALFRREREMAKYDVGTKLQGFLTHRLKRFGDDAAFLRSYFEQVQSIPDCVRDAAKRVDNVARTVDRLDATKQFLKELTLDEGHLRPSEVMAYIIHWFKKHSYGVAVDVTNQSTVDEAVFDAKRLIDLCLLIDELVFNACLHSKPSPSRFSILIRIDHGLRICIQESFLCVKDVTLNPPVHEPYREFLKRRVEANSGSERRGQGFADIEQWEKSLGVSVTCSLEHGREREYVVQGHSSSGVLLGTTLVGECNGTGI